MILLPVRPLRLNDMSTYAPRAAGKRGRLFAGQPGSPNCPEHVDIGQRRLRLHLLPHHRRTPAAVLAPAYVTKNDFCVSIVSVAARQALFARAGSDGLSCDGQPRRADPLRLTLLTVGTLLCCERILINSGPVVAFSIKCDLDAQGPKDRLSAAQAAGERARVLRPTGFNTLTTQIDP